MKLIETLIDKPVFAIVLSLIIILFGILSYVNLETRYFPNVPTHTIQVDTNYSGAGAKLIEENVNTPIEEALSTISGIDTLTSSAQQGSGTVTIKFLPGVDFSEKASEVREKISSVRSKLPDDIEPPIVSNRSHDSFLLDIALVDPNMTTIQLRDYVERYVKDKIQEISGVGDIYIWGANRYAMRIWLDAAKMAAHKITVEDIRQTLENNNIQMPGGEFKSTTMNFPINETTELHTANEFNNLVITAKDGKIVRLRDIGIAKLGSESDPYYARFNGQPAIGMDICLESGANPITVAKAIRQQLPLLQAQFPPGMQAYYALDISNFYKQSVYEVYFSILLAIICVVSIIFLFLGSFRAVFIPVVTIPICIFGAFCFISIFGFSINMLTLLAIVLSIGLIVDDSIVVMENIHRHIENRLTPYLAAKKGVAEITFPIIAMTLTLVGVYAPIGFLHSKAALITREFAFTLAGAVLVSGFVALTLSPMMCAKLLKQRETNRYLKFLDMTFDWLKTHYAKFLHRCLSFRWVIMLICLCVIGAGIFVYFKIPKQFIPSEDSGIIRGGLTTPTGSNSAYTFNFTKQLENIASQNPGIADMVSFAYDNTGEIVLRLKPYDKRNLTAAQIRKMLINSATNKTPGFNGYFSVMGYNFSQHDLEFYIMTSANYRDLYKITQNVMTKLKSYKGLQLIDTDMKFDSQQYNVKFNRDIAENMGINAKNVDDTISVLLGSANITNFLMGGQSYKVIAQANNSIKDGLSIINSFYLKNAFGGMVPLKNLVSLQSVLAQQQLNHYDRLHAAMISAQLKSGYQLSEVVRYLQKNLSTWLPPGTKYAFDGKAKHLLETGNSMNLILLLGIIFIYLVLSAQFGSFIDPFIILLTVPLSVIGGLIFLKLFGGSMNLYTDISLITLVGLVAKHGILITQFANKIREQQENINIKDAVIMAASIRLRPILMTTGAMIFGALPLLFATGFGATGRAQIGQVIVGGLLFGTFFSLVLTPVAYTYLAKFKRIKHPEG
ncbi:MAG: efflux RND transporter permease subunit [Gammaproteobacteria bacterium]|jgi:hydrophobe/amphiphile efflux-1 (HAE1) family protein